MKTAEKIIDENTFVKDGLITVENAIKCMEEYASQFHPSPKEGHCPTCGCEVRIEGNTTQYYVPVSSPKEISEDEIEGLFLAKYGNKITASDSWVIRFALECVRKFSLPSSGTDISK